MDNPEGEGSTASLDWLRSVRPLSWAALRGVVCFLLALAVFLLAGCGSKKDGSGGPGRPSIPLDIAGIELKKGTLGWNGIRLGMTPQQVSKKSKDKFQLLTDSDPNVTVMTGAIYHVGRTLNLVFDKIDGKLVLVELSYPMAEKISRDKLVEALKRKIPGLVYRPSPVEPDLKEEENPIPTYALPSDPNLLILIKADERLIWLSFADYLDN